MADNITLNAGSGGAIIATDDVGGVQYQLVKVTFGADGTATDVSSSSPLPVTFSGAVALATGANVVGGVTQSGTWNVAVSNASLAITAAALPLPTGAATDASVTAVGAKLPSTIGQKVKTGSLSVVTASDDDSLVLMGPVNETAPASDTAASGLNGRLQRIAQRLSSLIALLPSSLGVKTAANSLSVAPASDSEFSVRSAAPAAAVTASIASGGSLTPSIDLGAERLHRIALPASWTVASITFQTSPDGTTWNDLYDYVNGEVVATSAAGGRSLVLDQAMFYGIRYLKIRSGTSGTPVNQIAQRDLLLVTVPR